MVTSIPPPIPIPANQPETAFIPQTFTESSVVRSVQNRQKIATTTAATTVRPRTTTEPETEEELEDQAKSAFYEFGTSVHDTINDHEHVRKEVREGLALTGMYS